ncbi:hypothetical protein TNCV_1215961 [Trichonephila clavipes]|nr:hypothetical protein TNCV_1215961 [Trichonephila clavipes]
MAAFAVKKVFCVLEFSKSEFFPGYVESLGLMPQLQDDLNNLILRLDGAPPHWSANVRDDLTDGLDADHKTPLTQWPLRSDVFVISSWGIISANILNVTSLITKKNCLSLLDLVESNTTRAERELDSELLQKMEAMQKRIESLEEWQRQVLSQDAGDQRDDRINSLSEQIAILEERLEECRNMTAARVQERKNHRDDGSYMVSSASSSSSTVDCEEVLGTVDRRYVVNTETRLSHQEDSHII